MIRTFHARNYGCLLDATASLTPLHAFVGPNDSGKSTLLHGLRTLVQLASSRFTFDKAWSPFEPRLPLHFPAINGKPEPHDILLACAVDGGWYSYDVGAYGARELAGVDENGDTPTSRSERLVTEPRGVLRSADDPSRLIVNQLAGARRARFDPDALRAPSGLIPETELATFDDRGHGLAGVYFAIRNEAVASIVEDVRRLFPTIRGLRVKAVTKREVVLEAELANGTRVDAARMSEGLLYYLAFAALRFLEPTSLLLVEEPENGLHPARIAEVVKVLRAVAAAGTQVLIATHSPLVINELQPEEVSIVTRTLEQGTRVTPIADTPSFDLRSKAYALGELWLSYANGVDEAPLLQGGPRP